MKNYNKQINGNFLSVKLQIMWVVQRLKNNCLYNQMAFDSFEKAMEYKEKLKGFKLGGKIVWNYLEQNNDGDWDEGLPFN